MSENTFFDETDLPLSSNNETLETISRNRFRTQLDVEKFEIRSETERDKGIDFHIELKKKHPRGSVYTNFRFVVQLKATEAIGLNSDGSISLSIGVSNINYLLRNSMPAYYVLYYEPLQKFYYEDLRDFIRDIEQRKDPLNQQASYTLRFTKILDQAAIDLMYNQTMERGKFLQVLNETDILRKQALHPSDKIVIDTNHKIVSDAEVRELVEKGGFMLINQNRWNDIIALHEKASSTVGVSSLYNMILGIANYYSGNLFEALTFLKAARSLAEELAPELKDHLAYFDIATRYAVGLISENNYYNAIDKLKNSSDIGNYVLLEEAKKAFLDNENPKRSFEEYAASIHKITESSTVSENLKISAATELLLLEGENIIMDYIRNVALINDRGFQNMEDIDFTIAFTDTFNNNYNNWSSGIEKAKKDARSLGNDFLYYNARLTDIRIKYHFIVTSTEIHIVHQIPGLQLLEPLDTTDILIAFQHELYTAQQYYEHIGHIENRIAALTLLYEILHYTEDYDNADKVLEILEGIVTSYEQKSLSDKFAKLREEGPYHETFYKFLNSTPMVQIRKKLEAQNKEMREMDCLENIIENRPLKDMYQITLFPIGDFSFPKDRKTDVYTILNITEEAQVAFDNMLGWVVPVANIYHQPIVKEGYADGIVREKDIASRENLYRIRKKFFEEKFYRIPNR